MMQKAGTIRDISSTANPEIKAIKGLALKKNRAQTGTFLAEGLKLSLDAMDAGWVISRLLVAKPSLDEPLVAKTVARALALGATVLTVSPKILAAVSRRDNPQHVIAVIEQKRAQLHDLKLQNSNQTLIALDRVRDPGNLGTIIRTADAAGVSGIVMVGDCVDLFSLETVRATMGSLFAVPIAQATPETFLQFVKSTSCQLIGSHLAGAIDYRTIDYTAKPSIIFMGNEQSGLPVEMSQACDQLAKIPQVGQADSLNLAIATALMIYEARRGLLNFSSEAKLHG